MTVVRTRGIARVLALLVVAALALVALSGCASDGVQRFNIDASSGDYVPNAITAKAGAPVSITFSQAQGCTGRLVFPDFGIAADLSQGPKTFDLGVLKPGTYQWSCGMNMKHGVLTVQ